MARKEYKKYKRTKFLLYIVASLMILAVLLLYFAKSSVPPSYKEQVAKCLTSKDAVMYGASWCGHCAEQKSLFGDAFEFLNYVECTEQQELCTAKNIEGYPTWEINGKLYPGVFSLESLAEMAGC